MNSEERIVEQAHPDSTPHPAGSSDEELLKRYFALRGKADFEQLILRFHTFAFRVAKCVCADPHLAEEAVQEAFIRLCAKTQEWRFTGRGPGSCRAWFFQFVSIVARNYARSEHRRAMRSRSERYREQTLLSGKERSGIDPDLRENRDSVEKALAALGEEFRLPIVLHFLEGISQPEIGRMTGVSTSQVSRRIARGLALLHIRMAEGGVAVSVVALPVLLKAGGLLEAPPAGTRKLLGLGKEGPASEALKAARSVAGPKTGSSSFWMVVAALFLAAGATAWWSGDSQPAYPEPRPWKNGTPSAKTTAELLQEQDILPRSWVFRSSAGSRDFQVLAGGWSWQSAQTGKTAGMRIGEMLETPLPLKTPSRPFKVNIEYAPLYSGRTAISLGLYYTHKRHALFRRLWNGTALVNPEETTRTDFHCTGSWVIGESKRQVNFIAEYDRAFPSSQITLLLSRVMLFRLEISELKDSDTVLDLAHPEKLISQFGLAEKPSH